MGNDAPTEQDLAQVQRMLTRGEHAAAVATCRKLLDRSSGQATPGHAKLRGLLGLGLLHGGAIESAGEALQQALAAGAAESVFLNALGIVRMQQQRPVQAVELFERCLARSPFDRDALGNLSALYTAASQPLKARPYLISLARLLPESADVQARLADNLLSLGDVAGAVHAGRRAVRISPEQPSARFALADALEAAGRFKHARMQYDAVLEIHPEHPSALAQLLSLRGTAVSPEHAAIAQRVLDRGSLSAEDRVRLHMGLARHLDASGDFAEAFKHLRAGNDARARLHPFDSSAFSQAVDRLIACHPPQSEVSTDMRCAAVPMDEAPPERPIFIVGMPRSGTTLVEQILASHSQVAAGGEQPTIINLARALDTPSSPYPDALLRLDASQIRQLRERYLERLRLVNRSARHVTDKMPYNFMHLGLIARLFPAARIIHCRRDALDTCLSCYFTEFNEQFEFASDLATLGQYWLDYDRLLQHWRQALPLAMLEIDYEQLVTRTEATVRTLLQHCGLGFEPRCLEFYRSEAGVLTPSRWQVRQPIYRRSLGRWRNYASELAPLRRMLEPAQRRLTSPSAVRAGES